jgi:hypothetical protein
MVYYSMNNLRGRTGSTRHFMRGLGCNADSSTFFAGQRNGTDERFGLGILGWRHIELGRYPYGYRKFGHLCVEKGMHTRSQQNQHCCASISRKNRKRSCIPYEVVRLSDTSVGLWHDVPIWNKSDSSIGRGMLTITGSNVHRGTEMPVAATIFSRSGMGIANHDAHARSAAVAQRLHSKTFEGGECSLHNATKATKVGGLM